MDILFILFSGLTIGVIGSLHCIGMCGPLALSLPVHQLSSFQKYSAIGLYNFGRVISYGFMGVVFGIIGMSFSLFKIQQWLSVGAGLFILFVVLWHQFGYRKIKLFNRFSDKIKSLLIKNLNVNKNYYSYLNIGIINGFLPCGLVYVAIASAVATGSIPHAGLLMVGFGLGTLPLMASLMIFGNFISFNVKRQLNRLTPYFIMAVAMLLILRGLNLGIPIISPSMDNGQLNCCHKK
ncbi:MAG: sulfite exporter TauE/SafE family protein [Saprospiraceae bacterium]